MSKVILPRINQTGTNEWSDVEANDVALRNVVNGEIDSENIRAGGITTSLLGEGSVSLPKLGVTVLNNFVTTVGNTSAPKIARGNVAVTVYSSDHGDSGGVGVFHGLGVTPVSIQLTPSLTLGYVIKFSPRVTYRDAGQFNFQVISDQLPSSFAVINIDWVAFS